MRALVVTHCILLALAVGMLASSGTHAASPAPTIGGTTAQAGCPASTNTAAAGQGRSSGFVGFRLDDTIQPGSSCAWTVEAPSSSSALVMVARRVEDLSANTKITSAMFNATILANAGGNSSASASSSISSGRKESSLSSSASASKSADRRRHQATDDDVDDNDSKQGSSKSTSKSSKTSDAPTASNDDDDDDTSSKKASSKSKSKSSKQSDDGDDDDDSSNKGSSKSKSKSTGSGSRAAHNTNNNGHHQAQKEAVVVVRGTPVKVTPHSKQNSRLVIQASRAVPSSSTAAKVVVGVRYTYAEAGSLRATLRDVTLSGTRGTLVIGSSSTKRQSTQVTFADAKDSSLVLSCANAEYFVKVNSVSGTAADAVDSVTFIGDMSQSSSTCTYTAPSSSNTWTAAHGSQPCVGAQFIVNYKTTSKSSSSASIKVDYTCESESVAKEEVNGAQVHETEPNKRGDEDKSAEIAVAIAAVAVALVVVVIVVVVCCYFKNRTRQQQKRRQEGIDVQASQHHHQRAGDDSLSRPSSAMSEDTTVAMDRWEAATRENATTVAAVAEEDDHCSVTVTAAKTAADLAFEHKKLKLVEDGDLHPYPYTPQEPLKDQGEEVTRSSRLTTRSSAGSCGSYGTVDTPRPNLTLNNDDE